MRRRGLRWEPTDGWLLDRLLVGVATLRTTRELLRQAEQGFPPAPRGWDLALWSGVTPQGSADALERLARLGLVRALPPSRPWRAPGYRLHRSHPLVAPLSGLFETERALCRRPSRISRPPAG